MIRPNLLPALSAAALLLVLTACAVPRPQGAGEGGGGGGTETPRAENGAPGGDAGRDGTATTATPETAPSPSPTAGPSRETGAPPGQATTPPVGERVGARRSACEESVRRARERGLPVSGDCGAAQAPVPPPGAAGGRRAEPLREADNEDAMAAMIREAAENETDPEVRARLWEEYRNYVGEAAPAR